MSDNVIRTPPIQFYIPYSTRPPLNENMTDRNADSNTTVGPCRALSWLSDAFFALGGFGGLLDSRRLAGLPTD
jgi:hypothetical protein